jgi:hypothetical protein
MCTYIAWNYISTDAMSELERRARTSAISIYMQITLLASIFQFVHCILSRSVFVYIMYIFFAWKYCRLQSVHFRVFYVPFSVCALGVHTVTFINNATQRKMGGVNERFWHLRGSLRGHKGFYKEFEVSKLPIYPSNLAIFLSEREFWEAFFQRNI